MKAITKSSYLDGGRHCRHCGDGHTKHVRRPNSKDMAKLEEDVMEFLRYGVLHNLVPSYGVTREGVANHLNVQPHQVEQVFHKLNLRGYMRQGLNKAPHDSTRDPWGGHGSAWIGTLYPLILEKFAADLANMDSNEQPKNKRPAMR